MIQKIQSKNFIINDPETVDFMRSHRIGHLKFNIILDEDIIHISMEYPDYENLLVLEKKWFKVHYGKRVTCVRTPAFLKKFVGKEVEIYKEEVFPKEFEIFRVRPVGFDLISGLRNRRRRVKMDVPYFSKSGYCVIPKKYIKDHKLIEAVESKLSFNRMNRNIAENGLIFARITTDRELGALLYPLRKCSNGISTRSLAGVVDIISRAGKKITNFQYKTTVHDDNYHYDLIVFKEVNLDES